MEKREQGTEDQHRVNRLLLTEGRESCLFALRELASTIMPIPIGYFGTPDWLLAQASGRVTGIGGVQCEPGDVVFMRQDAAGAVVFFSVRLGGICVAGRGLEPLGQSWAEVFEFWRVLRAR